MNIFVLDEDPKVAAEMACDKHVVRMIMETAQMLCTVARSLGRDDAPYKSTHARHPCTVWAGETLSNWQWLVTHGKALCAEYTKRYGKVHKSEAVIDWCINSKSFPKAGPLTPFAQAMPERYKNADPVQAYRHYYVAEKSRFAKWNYSDTPWWWENWS